MSETDTMRPDTQFARDWVRAQRTVSAFVSGAIPSFHDAEDVIQKIAVKAFEICDRFDPAESQFSTWVIGIARHEVLHWYRAHRRDRLVFDETTLAALAEATDVLAGHQSDLQEALLNCLQAVHGRGREVLELRYGQSLRSREIATRLDTSENTVNVTLSRVRAALLRCIEGKTRQEGAPA
jgi:RNA polymerase sigma-70 factor, ECF subfamily